MTDQVVEEVVANDQQDDAGFIDGFNQAMGNEPSTVETPPAEPEAPAPEEAPKEEPVEESIPLTKTEVQSLISRLDELDKLRSSQDKAFGHIGALKETIEKLRTAQATGEPAEITDEDMKEIAEDFPEFGGKLKGVLQKISGKFRGGGQQAATTFDPTPMREEFASQLTERDQKYEKRILRAYHKDWQTVVHSDGFKLWMETQPEDYRTKVGSSWDAEEIADAIDTFKEHNVKKAASADLKKKKNQRLEAAVTPAGVRSPDTTSLSDDDAFINGFKAVRGR